MGERPPVPALVGLIGVLAAAGAVFFLVQVAEMGAYIVHPGGLQKLHDAAGSLPGNPSMAAFTASAVLLFVLVLAIALLHLATFVTLQRRSQLGWVLAVLLSSLWSLVLIGIPFLVTLLRSSTRRAFGFS